MASSIVVPTKDQLGNYPPSIADQLITVASAAQSDINALQGGSVAGVEQLHLARAATTAALAANTYSSTNKTLTGNSPGAIGAQDGVTLVAGDRLLVRNESTGSHNGLYSVTAVGGAGAYVLTRVADMTSTAQLQAGMLVQVSEGTANASSTFMLTTAAPLTLDSTALTFDKIASKNEFVNAIQFQVPQAVSASSLTELMIAGMIGTGNIIAAYYLPNAASAPASGSNNQVILLQVYDNTGSLIGQLATATLANGTPMTKWVRFSLGTITNGAYLDSYTLTAKTTLTGTATLPAGTWIIVATPN